MGEGQKKAVIVGATSGIGLELVKVLTAQGWQVGIAGRRQERLQQIQSKNLDVVATECIDITKEDAPRRLLTLIGKTGGMDLYFHSAGIGYQNSALDMDKEMATLILKKKLRELDDKLEAKNVKMTLTPEAFDHLLKEGFTAEYGAREMDRVIAQQLKPLLMREILFGNLKQGGNITVGIVNCQLSIVN